jgi:Flp pilus assembly protein TadG
MRAARVRGHYERGNVLLEFAFAGSVAMMMLLGIVEFGRALYDYHLVSNAARIGSRYAIVHGADCFQTLPGCTAVGSAEVQTYVRSVSPGIDPTALTVTTTWTPPANSICSSIGAPYKTTGCVVTVNAQYTFTVLVPLVPLQSFVLSSTSTMVMSQ